MYTLRVPPSTWPGFDDGYFPVPLAVVMDLHTYSTFDESTFSALVSIWGSRTVYVGVSPNKLQFVCSW